MALVQDDQIRTAVGQFVSVLAKPEAWGGGAEGGGTIAEEDGTAAFAVVAALR